MMINKKGTTLIELIIAIAIGSLVIKGAYDLFLSISIKLDREQRKSIVYEEITRVIKIIEKDIRMSGYNIPGPGVEFNEEDSSFSFFSNKDMISTSLVENSDNNNFIVVDNAELLIGSNWIFIDTLNKFYKVDEIQNDRIYTYELINANIPAGSLVYRVEKRSFKIDDNKLIRSIDNTEFILSNCINILKYTPIDNRGEINFNDNTKIKSFGIIIGSNMKLYGRDYLVIEKNHVNLRNYYR